MKALRQIESTYWPTYIYDVWSEMKLGNSSVSFRDALQEATDRKNRGLFSTFLKERQEWNAFVSVVHLDMKRTFGMHVGIPEAVAEACKERDLQRASEKLP